PQHQAEQRAFAGAVVADQAEDFTAPAIERDVAECVHGAIVLAHLADADNSVSGCRGSDGQAISSSRNDGAACAVGDRSRWGRAAVETVAPPGSAIAPQGWPAAVSSSGVARTGDPPCHWLR